MKLHFYVNANSLKDQNGIPIHTPIVTENDGCSGLLAFFLYREITKNTSHLYFDALTSSLYLGQQVRVTPKLGYDHSIEIFKNEVFILTNYADEVEEDNQVSLQVWQLLKAIFYWRAFLTGELGVREYFLDLEEE